MLSRAQLLDVGLSARAIKYRLTSGRLHLLHRNVYAIGHIPPSPLARAMAAVLACGGEAWLGYRAAAPLWDITRPWRGPVEVVATSAHHHHGVLVHRSRTLTPADVTVHYGIPITTPARTIIDLADVLSDRAYTRAVNEAQVQRRVTREGLAAALARSPGRRATGRLRPFLHLGDGPTRSQLEDAFVSFCECHDLPRPEINAKIAGFEVDALWRRQRVVIELDGRQFHDHDQPFERDRDKDADLLTAGLAVVRVTSRRIEHRPGREATRLRQVLAQREPLPTPPPAPQSPPRPPAAPRRRPAPARPPTGAR